MSWIKDLLYSTLQAKDLCDPNGEQFEDCQKEHEAQAPGQGGGTGTGLPSDVGAYKYMATDGEGKWVAEDRLAWKGNVKETLLNQTVEFSTEPEGDVYWSVSDITGIALSVGSEYDVIWDDVAYKCTAKETEWGSYLGNFALTNEGEDTGEPFYFYSEVGGSYVYSGFATNESGAHSVSIIWEGEKTKRIGEEYLPILSDEPQNTVLFPEQGITVANHIYLGKYYDLPADFPGIENGKTYIIKYDDDVYTITANGSEITVDGKFTIKEGQTTVSGWHLFFVNAATGDTHTLEIAVVGSRKIKDEYIPDDIVRTTDLPSVITFNTELGTVNIASYSALDEAINKGAIVRVILFESPYTTFHTTNAVFASSGSAVLWYTKTDGTFVKSSITAISDGTFEYTEETVGAQVTE